MLPNLPAYIPIVFILTVILAIYLLFRASWSGIVVAIALVWLAIQGILSFTGFYLNTAGSVPRISLAILPPLVLILLILITKKGKKFTRRLDLRALHLLHIVRIPVELCLYWLSLRKAVPELVTFAGNNMDIITGITVPILFLTCFKGRSVRSVNLLFGWNIIGLVMLGSAVVNGLLSAPSIYQRLAFDQPNIAILYFPFIWLPSFIIMALLFSHLVMIKRLMGG
jgi:hypothetical protein